jgi:pimeloyl-ACP methyl ester carboxylesterase
MKKEIRKPLYWFIMCVVAIVICAVMAFLFEHDFGRIGIQKVKIDDGEGHMLTGKLYLPKGVSAENKLPAVLNLHGYQNDKDVQAPFSIELARRGFVVLALDALGHGDSQGGLDVSQLGVPPYTAGHNAGYLYLKTLPYVDTANLGVMGHSMGAIDTLLIGYLNPDHRALNFQCGLAGSPDLKNVLLTQAKYDEFALFRENELLVPPLKDNPAREAAFGLTSTVEWDTTYGDFAAGTARRAALINMEHHFLPLTNKAVAEAVDWMRLALKGGAMDAYWIKATRQTFLVKEFFGMGTLLITIFSLIPLTTLLLKTKFFAPVDQPMPSRYAAKTGTWWIYATINALIGGITYPLLTQYTGLSDKVQGIIPWMKLQVGNGLYIWFLANAVICLILFCIWYFTSAKKNGINMYDMGLSFDRDKCKINWAILGKTVLLGIILFAWMYILEGLSQLALGQEFRFAWPFMRQFSSWRRVGYFLWYIIPVLAFFLINGGIFLYGQARQKAFASGAKTQWIWWLKILYAGLFGLLLVWLIQYIPWMVFGKGPGFELMGKPQFSALWPLMLQVYIPEFAILLFMTTWFYRKTGKVYLGALMVSILAMWFLTAGTIIAK